MTFDLGNITKIADQQCPLRDIHVKKVKMPWVNKGLLEMMVQRDNAYRLFKATRNPDDWQTYT